jgi:hypothetical protein
MKLETPVMLHNVWSLKRSLEAFSLFSADEEFTGEILKNSSSGAETVLVLSHCWGHADRRTSEEGTTQGKFNLGS